MTCTDVGLKVFANFSYFTTKSCWYMTGLVRNLRQWLRVTVIGRKERKGTRNAQSCFSVESYARSCQQY